MIRTAIFALLFAAVAHAETTIVPLRGDFLSGWDGYYDTTVLVTNLGRTPVSVRRGEVYPVSPQQHCSDPAPVVIQPLTTRDVPTGCTSGLYAYTLESDGPIRVDTVITKSRLVALPVGFTSSRDHQQVPSAREWLPAHRLAIIPVVGISSGEAGSRTNLFVTNPGDHDLTLDLRITTLSPLFPFRDERHRIKPRSTAAIRLAPVPAAECELPLVCGGVHRLTLTADAPYYASASVVDYGEGDAQFFPATAQEP